MSRLDLAPPPVELEPSLSWVLARSFGPVDGLPFRARVDPEACVRIAEELGLSPRIGGRVGEARLAEELGGSAAGRFRHEHLAAAAREGLLENSRNKLAAIARRTGTPLILLKHAALRAVGIVSPGFRTANDVDVLVPLALTRPFFAALEASGYRRNGTRAYEHQLPQLLDPTDTLIEVHRHIPGVRLAPSSGFVTGEELLATGLVSPARDALVPAPPLLAAHAIAHGFLQNAGAPQSISPLRVIADLADLGARAPDALARAGRFLDRGFDEEDLAALRELTALAVSGDLSGASGSALTLLRHCVAIELDPEYCQSLAVRAITRPLSQHGRVRATLDAISIALFPDRAAMDLLHGSSRSLLERSVDRLVRPLVLIGRGARTVTRRILS